MIRILFVCHGNICRSTSAQWIMSDLVKKAGLEDEFFIDSAALFSDEIDSPIYPPAKAVLKAHHIPVGSHFARRMTKHDAQTFDHIYYMDAENKWALERLLSDDLLAKCQPLRRKGEIADPWYTRNFELAYSQIDKACKERLGELVHEV